MRFRSNWEANNGRLQTALFAAGFVVATQDSLPDEDIQSILDYGCGCGESLPVLRMRFPKAALCYYDFSRAAMRRAAKYYGSMASAFDPTSGRTFDLVYCSNVIEHVADLRAFVVSLADLARRYVAILAPYDERHVDGAPLTTDRKKEEHVRTITSTSLDDITDICWRTKITTVPYAWPHGPQILFLGEHMANRAPK